MLGGGLRSGRGNVFKFEGHHADVRRKTANGVKIVIGRNDFEVGHLAGGRVGVGRKGVHAIAHAAGGDGEHASELSAAEDAKGGTGENGGHTQHASGRRGAARTSACATD